MRTYKRRDALKECIEPIEGVLGLCRLCLEQAKESVPIFANKNDICTSLATRIMICVGYEITQEECLPNTICTECQKELNNYYEFRKKCNRTYHKLKTHLFAVKARIANELKAKQAEEKANLINNAVYMASPSVCIDSQSVGQSLSQRIGQSVNQPISSLVSQSITVSKDQLILAFDDITQLEFVHFEPGLANNIVNVNGFTDGAVLNKGLERSNKEPVQTNPPTEVCPDITEFLSSILVEMGIMKKLPNELKFMTEECRSIVIETGDSEQIQLEIVQMEEEEPNTKKIRKVKGKEKNDDTKSQKDKRRACGVCARTFASGGVLARHARVHTGERPYRCAHCGAGFGQREVMRRHELVHREVRPFACAHCPKSFTQRAALAAHARTHEPPDAKGPVALHRCTSCPKAFQHASGLSRHMMRHAGRLFLCPHCDRRFNDESSLRRHARCKHERPPQEI